MPAGVHWNRAQNGIKVVYKEGSPDRFVASAVIAAPRTSSGVGRRERQGAAALARANTQKKNHVPKLCGRACAVCALSARGS